MLAPLAWSSVCRLRLSSYICCGFTLYKNTSQLSFEFQKHNARSARVIKYVQASPPLVHLLWIYPSTLLVFMKIQKHNARFARIGNNAKTLAFFVFPFVHLLYSTVKLFETFRLFRDRSLYLLCVRVSHCVSTVEIFNSWYKDNVTLVIQVTNKEYISIFNESYIRDSSGSVVSQARSRD